MTHNPLFSCIVLSLIAAATSASRAKAETASINELPAPFHAEEFQKHVAYLAADELAGRAPGSEGSAKAAQYLVEHFEKLGLKPALGGESWFQPFPLNKPEPTSGSVTGRNIVAQFEGSGELAREAVIVCAHYDHLGKRTPDGRGREDTIYNGADDNASGVAALLLMAKALANDEQSLPSPRRTVLFISFDAEEQGLAGARNYVKRPAWPLENTSAVLNFDAMGRMRLGKFFASDVETNPMLADAVREAAALRKVVVETRFGGHGRSDHAVFLERGIPGTHFFTGANRDYHQVTDHHESLNFTGGADLAWIGYQVLRKAITFKDRIEYRELDPSFDATFLLNVAQQMGIVPNVNAQEGRYPQILFVLPNSLGAKHGIKSGDQITAINGLEFNRVEDGITIFQQLNFEDGIQISILRGDRIAEIKIPASAFEKLTGPKATPTKDGKYEVLFRYQAPPGTKSAYLAGEFNEWQPMTLRMEGPDDDGNFTKQLELAAGSYQYKFVVNGTQWQADPQNMYKFGSNGNSVVWVGPRK